MCGIVGFIDFGRNKSKQTLERQVAAMTDTLIHRGPDGSGTWVDEKIGVALGHRRLAVIDLSPEGHQPMASPSGRYVIVFNGEVYNFWELRKDLEKRGYAWRGHSDTEVMLAAFEALGVEEAIKNFVGMFAFVLMDTKEGKLYLFRDRMGEKPLYYGWVGKIFLFGSELKVLRSHPAWRGDIDRDALCLFLRHNYIPTPYSIYKGIRKLLPGTFLCLNLDTAHSVQEPKPYWSLKEQVLSGKENSFQGTEEEAREVLHQLLKRSVRHQMVADVPLGAFLSGGIDSSTIVALMQDQRSQPVKTFTIGFWEKDYSEANRAKMVAQHLGTEHTELYVTPKEALEVIPKLPEIYDEPFADASQVPTYLISKLTRNYVTVCLSGDGGDELFAGYNRYYWSNYIWKKVRKIPVTWRSFLSRRIQALSPDKWDRLFCALKSIPWSNLRQRTPGYKLHKLAEVITARDAHDLYYGLTSCWKSPEEVIIGGKEPSTLLTDGTSWPVLTNFTEHMQYLDMCTYLQDDILVKVDRASMAVSLESRAPYLDHRIAEFSWRLPMSMKINDGKTKWLLRQVLYNYVPRELVDRPKAGFALPIDSWLRGPLRDWAEELLKERHLKQTGYLNPIPIRKKWTDHLSGKGNWQYYLWNILMFQLWLEANSS